MTESAPAPALQARDLSKVFLDFWRRPRVHALRSLTLDVPAGKVFGLLGPNGSGKSTTIKLVLGLLFPTSGTLRVLGAAPTDVAVKARIGYLPEETRLYPHLTPLETLRFYGALFNLPAATVRTRSEQLLRMVGLHEARNRVIGHFSKGMARRIGLAQALLNDPDLVILDEPSSGLDPQGARQVKDVIRALAARGKTVLLTSHLLADVQDVCDEIAVLFHGTLLAQGPLDDLLLRRDLTSLTFPSPAAPGDLDSLVADVRQRTGADPEVSHPRTSLEPFFLDLVRKASPADPSGAVPSQPLAPFLSGKP